MLTSFWLKGNTLGLLEINETSLVLVQIWVKSEGLETNFIVCGVFNILLKLNFIGILLEGEHYNLAPIIVWLAPAIDCRASLSPLLVKTERESEKWREWWDFYSLPTSLIFLTPHLSFSYRFLSLLLRIPLVSISLFPLCSCKFSKTKCISSSQEHQQANHRCLKPNAYRIPLQHPLVIDQTGCICLPGLLWWLIGPGVRTMCTLYCGFKSGLLYL